MSRLLWAVATLGLRPNPFAALLWWWTRVATTATGPLRQLQGDPCAAARAGAPASRLHDRRRRTSAAGQRLWPQPSHHRRRPGRTRVHGARLDPAGKGARRVAARPRHHRGPHVGPDAACDRPAGTAPGDAMSALATAAAASVRRLGPPPPPWQIIAMIARG